MDISEFIIAEEDISAIEEKVKVKKPAAEIEYEVELASGCDLIIKRSSPRTERRLVLLLSQNLLYEMNKKDKIEVTEASFKKFFKDLDSPIELDGCNWLDKIVNQTYNLSKIYSFIKNERCREMAKKGLYTMDMYEGKNDYTHGCSYEIFKTSPNFMRWIKQNIPANKMNKEIYMFACEVYKTSPDNAKYFLLKASKTSMYTRNTYATFSEIYKKANYDFKTLTDYLFFGLYKQGYDTMNVLNTLKDYINLSIRVYGTVKDKYPKDLNMQHNILARIARSMNYRQYEEDFLHTCKQFKELEFKHGNYLIKIPTTYMDLVEEGTKLGHCVAEYIEKVAKQECMIMLMRKVEEPDEPYLTVELRNYAVYEIEGDNRRFELTEDEKRFFRAWAKRYELSLDPNENFYDKFAA